MATRRRWHTISRGAWRAAFQTFADTLDDHRIYVTVDLDSLRAEEAATNWENGLFTAEDVAWAIRELREHGDVVGGDLCGAYSRPHYARHTQRLVAKLDHPKLVPMEAAAAQARNLATLRILWPALTGRDERHAGGDEADAQPELRRGALL